MTNDPSKSNWGIRNRWFYGNLLVQTKYKKNPLYFIVESENKINVLLFKPKTTQAIPTIELIPKKVEKYNLTEGKKSPLKEKPQPVDIADWTILAEMPTYKQPERVLQSDWWKAAAFLEMFVHWVFYYVRC